MNPTKLAIGAAVFLLVIALAGLAVTTKQQVQQIERGGSQETVEQKPDPAEESAGRLLTWLLIGALVGGILFALYKVYKEVVKWQTAPPRLKEPWELD